MKKNFCSLSYIQLAFGFTLLASGVAIGQMRVITGTVTENLNHKPLSGVTIFQEGSDAVAVSDGSGIYRLQVTGENPILVFKHPDYPERRVTLGSRMVVNVSMSSGARENEIEEVVLNAGYYKVKGKESTGSIARVTAKEIENQPVSNVLSAVQGRVPGVSITQNSGTPGGGFDIQIRGRSSLRTYLTAGYDGNVPLYVVDGVPLPSLSEYNSGLSAAVLPYNNSNPLNGINPDDIASFEILKDADATAIYGSRGANGVVLITTKKGSSGKTQVKLNTSYGIASYANLPKMMSTQDYLKMRQVAFANDGITAYPANQYDVNGTWDAGKFTDWQKYFVGNRAEQSDTQLSVSGGNSNTRYLLSGSHWEETTVFPGSYRYKRNTFTANTEHQSSDRRFKVSFTGYYTLEDNTLPPADFKSVVGTIAPNAPDLYLPSGGLNWQNGTFINPMAAASQVFTTQGKNLNANLNASYQLGGGFSVNVSGGYGHFDRQEQRIYPKAFYNPSANIGSERSALRKASMVNKNWIIEPQLNYDRKWGLHQVQALVGGSFQDQVSENITLLGTKFPSDELIYNMGSAATVTVAGTYQFHYRYQALYGRLHYGYGDRYFINLTARRDGSSRFGDANRFGNFGAAGVAWVFSKESFIKDLKWLSHGKLRGSYGVTGSDQIGDYQFYDTFIASGGAYDNYTAMVPSRLYNKNFGWETTRKLEAAMEWSMFRDRLSMTAAWYRNVSSNQLVGVPLPATAGFPSYQANLDATVLNKGFEVSGQVGIIRHKEFQWNASVNVTLPQNRLLEFPNLETSTYANSFMVGKSTTLVKLYHYTGIDPLTGLYTVEDVNKDGIINTLDRTVVRELKQHWFGGFQQNIRYKNWGIDVLFQFVKQNQTNIYAADNYVGSVGSKSDVYLDYWTPENLDAQFQKPTAGFNAKAVTASNLFKQSDATVSDIFTVRLKNVSVNYKIPDLPGMKVSARVFLQGQNLLMFSNYKGIDPEFNLQGYTTPLRVVSAGINLTF